MLVPCFGYLQVLLDALKNTKVSFNIYKETQVTEGGQRMLNENDTYVCATVE